MMQRMKELILQIKEADTAYYKYDKPIMTNRKYDLLYDELLDIESKAGIILSGSPTQKVAGEILEGLAEVAHTKPMLSAEKEKSLDGIMEFINNRPAIASWKLDGLTLVLRYENGLFKQAITRGVEGLIGEDVSHSARVMVNVPLTIPSKEPLEVRGEGVISYETFDKINANLDPGDEPYAHPRNLAAGSVRRLDAGKTKDFHIEFFAFELVSDHDIHISKMEQLKFLGENGFDTVPYKYIEADCVNGLDVINSFKPEDFGYPVDGLIIEYDDVVYGKSLGATGHHENRLISFKWEDELFKTKFLGLELATTRTGMISLTAQLRDVKIDGTTVNRAYLHNLDILDSFQLGIGDEVKVYKANKIIPQLAENCTKSGTLKYPERCPCCGSKLIIKASPSGTRLLYCENPACSAKQVRKFVHFCSKTRMNIEGFSETTLQKLISAGFLKNLGDLYLLHNHRIPIARMPGFGPTSVQNYIDAIEKSRKCTLNQFIAGLGIPQVGRTAGRVISDFFHGDWEAFEQAVQIGFNFTQLKDFGETMHGNIHNWYRDEKESAFWRPLLDHVEFIKEEKIEMNTNNPFYGKTVVATGTLENYTRDDIDQEIIRLGGKASHSVSKKTDFVIYGEGAGSKLTKAQELGKTTLTEAEFEAMKSGGKN